MPVFEHFPMRDIGDQKVSNNGDRRSDLNNNEGGLFEDDQAFENCLLQEEEAEFEAAAAVGGGNFGGGSFGGKTLPGIDPIRETAPAAAEADLYNMAPHEELETSSVEPPAWNKHWSLHTKTKDVTTASPEDGDVDAVRYKR